jgi:hypothetical protein
LVADFEVDADSIRYRKHAARGRLMPLIGYDP